MHRHEASADRERAVLVGVELPGQHGSLDGRLQELELLADTAGCQTVARCSQARSRPDARLCIGKGKADEVKAAAELTSADVVIFDRELTPAQARNLEELCGRTVIDRTQLILDIFALRARTRIARWQVELAQLQYELPRYRHMWSHLSRIEGGVGMRGPGETQLEVDRRRARERIRVLKHRLQEVERQNEVATGRRDEAFVVSLVGYTNVGKSTLMRALTDADVLVEDRLFATITTTTRRIEVHGHPLLLSDTVGFIRDLPHSLVASFHATLAEVLEADLLLHVVDLSSPELDEQIASVETVLTEIGADQRPRLLAYNKADLLPADSDRRRILERHGDGVVISAATGAGLDELRARLAVAARARHRRMVFRIPFADGRTAAYLEANATILERAFDADGVRLTALVSPEDAGRLARYAVTEPAT